MLAAHGGVETGSHVGIGPILRSRHPATGSLGMGFHFATQARRIEGSSSKTMPGWQPEHGSQTVCASELAARWAPVLSSLDPCRHGTCVSACRVDQYDGWRISYIRRRMTNE